MNGPTKLATPRSMPLQLDDVSTRLRASLPEFQVTPPSPIRDGNSDDYFMFPVPRQNDDINSVKHANMTKRSDYDAYEHDSDISLHPDSDEERFLEQYIQLTAGYMETDQSWKETLEQPDTVANHREYENSDLTIPGQSGEIETSNDKCEFEVHSSTHAIDKSVPAVENKPNGESMNGMKTETRETTCEETSDIGEQSYHHQHDAQSMPLLTESNQNGAKIDEDSNIENDNESIENSSEYYSGNDEDYPTARTGCEILDPSADPLSIIPNVHKPTKHKIKDPFAALAKKIFKMVDQDEDNLLSKMELDKFFQSKSLVDISITSADIIKMNEDSKHKSENKTKKRKKSRKPKTGLHFPEFENLLTEILKYIYGKSTECTGTWVELDGPDSLIYFNKITGEMRYDIPEEYYTVIKEDVFEDVILDLLEKQEANHEKDSKNKNPKIKGELRRRDFEEMLSSISFCLLLSSEDQRQIRKLFKNDKSSFTHGEFIPIAKRLVLLVYEARHPSPHDWCMLVSPKTGNAYWFHKRNGEIRRFPPHSVIRAQQQELMEREREKAFLKQTVDELNEYKEKYAREKSQRENFEDQCSKLTEELKDTKEKLANTTEEFETSKSDLQAALQKLTTSETSLTQAEERIKSLESKEKILLMDVEKAELTVETMKKSLDNARSIRIEKETELTTIKSYLELKTKNLQNAEQTIEELQSSVEDLKSQVMDEIRRNEQMDRDLNCIAELKQQIVDKDEEISNIQNQLDERLLLLQLARKTAKDYKDRIKELENTVSAMDDLEKDLQISRCETLTLKKLLLGKDKLVIQKSQALELAKEVLQEIQNNDQFLHMVKKAGKKATVQATFPQGIKSQEDEAIENGLNTCIEHDHQMLYDELTEQLNSARATSPMRFPRSKPKKVCLDINTPPCNITTSSLNLIEKQAECKQNIGFLEYIADEHLTPRSNRETNKTSVGQNRQNKALLNVRNSSSTDGRTSQNLNTSPGDKLFDRLKSAYSIYLPNDSFQNFRSVEHHNVADVRLETPQIPEQQKENGFEIVTVSSVSSRSTTRPPSSTSTSSSAQPPLPKLTKYEKDQLMLELIHVGDRVQVNLGPCKERSSPYYSGIVKFVGSVDREYASFRPLIGLKLDEPVGDTDGVYKGKRYFTVPLRHGKFVKATKIVSVLNPRAGRYKTIDESTIEYLRAKQQSFKNR
ncbi:uncharacterized protein LOC141914435 isoform X1 [Tubulanus polymorphus]|uniref:uncharacterized protein LOC141914435 isoform X1 n=1 Tax=Tubulanus polymorphus TaxID=672921 RepID=UPI003DA58516